MLSIMQMISIKSAHEITADCTKKGWRVGVEYILIQMSLLVHDAFTAA